MLGDYSVEIETSCVSFRLLKNSVMMKLGQKGISLKKGKTKVSSDWKNNRMHGGYESFDMFLYLLYSTDYTLMMKSNKTASGFY